MKAPAHVATLLVSRAEAAEVLSVCDRTLDKLIRAGTLRCVRIGRRVLIPASSLENVLNKRVLPTTPAPDDAEHEPVGSVHSL
jgi:excisionase family DNA binding protein